MRFVLYYEGPLYSMLNGTKICHSETLEPHSKSSSAILDMCKQKRIYIYIYKTMNPNVAKALNVQVADGKKVKV